TSQRVRRPRSPRSVSNGCLSCGRRLRRDVYSQRGCRARLPTARSRRQHLSGRGYSRQLLAAVYVSRAVATVRLLWARAVTYSSAPPRVDASPATSGAGTLLSIVERFGAGAMV